MSDDFTRADVKLTMKISNEEGYTEEELRTILGEFCRDIKKLSGPLFEIEEANFTILLLGPLPQGTSCAISCGFNRGQGCEYPWGCGSALLPALGCPLTEAAVAEAKEHGEWPMATDTSQAQDAPEMYQPGGGN